MIGKRPPRRHPSVGETIKPGPQMSIELATDCAQEVAKDAHNRRFGDLRGAKIDAEWLTRRCQRARQLSRTQLVQSVADGFALYGLVSADPSLQPAVLKLAKEHSIKRNSRTTILRVLLELCVSYGEGSEDPEDIARAQNNHSRNENAVKRLIMRGIKPSQLVELSKEAGEGLDAWSRRPSKYDTKPKRISRRKAETAVKLAKPKYMNEGVVIEITYTLLHPKKSTIADIMMKLNYDTNRDLLSFLTSRASSAEKIPRQVKSDVRKP